MRQEQRPLPDDAAPFNPEARVDWDGFQSALSRNGFTAETLAHKAGLARIRSSLDLEAALRRTRDMPEFGSLMRLFILGQGVEAGEIETALGKRMVADLLACGILRPCTPGSLESECSVVPRGDFIVLHDFGSVVAGGKLAPDHVLAVGDATMLLARMIPAVKAARAFDMGTGSGYLAMVLSRQADSVVATDICPRALAFARMTLAINGVGNVGLREGSFFDPVGGERFDLIVSNPPFAISPEKEFVFRDSGMQEGELPGFMLGGAAALLEEGGFAAIMLNWPHDTPDGWSAPVQLWADGLGCDVLGFRFMTQTPVDYAASWTSELRSADPRVAADRFAKWADYLEGMRIGFITLACVLLRKRGSGPNWARFHDAKADWTTGGRGVQVLRMFRNADVLSSIRSDLDLLDLRIRLVPEHLLSYAMEAGAGRDSDGGWSLKSAKLHLTEGFEFTANTDRNIASILALCDGNRTLKSAVDVFARGIGKKPEDLAGPCAAAIKPLLEGGFVEF